MFYYYYYYYYTASYYPHGRIQHSGGLPKSHSLKWTQIVEQIQKKGSTDRIGVGDGLTGVAVDGADEAEGDALAEQLVDPIEHRAGEVVEVQHVLLHQHHPPLDLGGVLPAARLAIIVPGDWTHDAVENLIHRLPATTYKLRLIINTRTLAHTQRQRYSWSLAFFLGRNCREIMKKSLRRTSTSDARYAEERGREFIDERTRRLLITR